MRKSSCFQKRLFLHTHGECRLAQSLVHGLMKVERIFLHTGKMLFTCPVRKRKSSKKRRKKQGLMSSLVSSKRTASRAKGHFIAQRYFSHQTGGCWENTGS